MPDNKATGSGRVSDKFVKLFINVLLPLLMTIFNKSIETSVFAIACKISKVTPLWKSGLRSNPQNYRPISVVPFLSKVLEKHVFESLYTFLIENHLLSEKQFGFERHHSINDALLSLKKTVITSLNINNKCIVVKLDLRKAFDLVSHELLLRKLNSIGCSDRTLNWFKSYLKNRKQFVRTQSTVSDIRDVGSVSVPQGSVGGPTLHIFC